MALPNGKEATSDPAGLADEPDHSLKGQGPPRRRPCRRSPIQRHGRAASAVPARRPPICGSSFRITLYEALLAARCGVPTLDGTVELAIPGLAPSKKVAQTFRLKGKGFPAKDGAGDLLATARIVLPTAGTRSSRR